MRKYSSGYGGYPVTGSSETISDSDTSRTPEQNAAAESHNRKPGLQSRHYNSMSPTRREQLLKQKAQDKARVKAKGKADPMSVMFANPESGGQANSPHVPGAAFAHGLSQLTVQGNNDVLGMTHTGSAQLRYLHATRKR